MSRRSQIYHLDPASYNWERLSNLPSRWQRKALSGECMWIPRSKEQREIFVGGALTFEKSITPHTLDLAARSAWQCLRFEIPELVVVAAYDQEGEAHMKYISPEGIEEVDRWVERTTRIEHGQMSLGFVELRDRILRMKEGLDSEQAFVFLHGKVKNGQKDSLKSVDFILNFDHQITDGTGARILTGRFLSLLASAFCNSNVLDPAIDWGESAKNLSPPWIGVMDEDQVLSGPGYEKALDSNREIIFTKLSQNPGLALLKFPRTSLQKSHFITLTEVQSTKLIQDVKRIVGPTATITHLGHAAMVIAMLRSNPPPSVFNTLYSPCWLNGRRYLQPFSHQPSPTKSYIPNCLSFAPVIFTDLQDLVLTQKATNEEIKEMLIKSCRMATNEYMKIREEKSVLPGNVAWMEEVGKQMWRSKENEAPTLDSNSLVQLTADPFMLSDGLTEQYIDHSYSDALKNKIFDVDEIKFAAHAEKNLIVRMSSWRGMTTISGEWVSSCFEDDMIVRFLEDVVGIMLSML